jgi:hypothetical protein
MQQLTDSMVFKATFAVSSRRTHFPHRFSTLSRQHLQHETLRLAHPAQYFVRKYALVLKATGSFFPDACSFLELTVHYQSHFQKTLAQSYRRFQAPQSIVQYIPLVAAGRRAKRNHVIMQSCHQWHALCKSRESLRHGSESAFNKMSCLQCNNSWTG